MFHLSKKARKVTWLKARMKKQAKGSKSFDLIHKNIFCIYIMAAQSKMPSLLTTQPKLGKLDEATGMREQPSQGKRNKEV